MFLPLPVEFYMVNPNLNEQSGELAFGQEEECGRQQPVQDFLDIIVSVPSFPTAFLGQNFLNEDCPSVNHRKHLLYPVLSLHCVFRWPVVFLKDRSCESLQTRSALLVCLKAPCRSSLVSREGLVPSGLAGAMSPGGDLVNQAGWRPREVSLYSQPVVKNQKLKML